MPMIHESSNASGPANSCSSTPPGVSDQATSYSSTPPSVSDQTTSCYMLSSVSDQATSCSTPASVSEQVANCVRQTSELSSVQHIESHETNKYLQMIIADECSDHSHVIDNDADYLQIIDDNDNYSTVDNKMGCNTFDDAESYREPDFPQKGYHPLIDDDCFYEEITDNEPSFLQVACIDHNYDQSFPVVQNQVVQVTSTREASFNTTPQLFAAQELSHNDELTGMNNRTKQRISKLLFRAAEISAVLLACSVVIYFVVTSTSRAGQHSSQLQQLTNTIEAFGLLRTRQDSVIINRLLTFDSVIRNVSSTSVDLNSSSFTAPQTASPRLYWMIIAVEVPIKTSARVQLANTGLIISKLHSTNSDKDIITKSGLVQLEPANVVTVRNDYAVNTAYWSGFCLNNIMQSLVAVFVASSKQLTFTSPDSKGFTKISYDTVIINEGKAWDTNNSVFVVPQTGFYVFSINIGFTSLQNPIAVLGVTTWTQRQNLLLAEAGIGEYISSKVDFTSTSRVLHLVEGATVEGMLARAMTIYSDSATLATSLSAFLYSPVSNKQVVWSVAKTTSGYLLPPFESPLTYDSVWLNDGGAWLPSQNTVVIATSGIYYVFVAINVCAYSRATLWLRINGERLLEIKSTISEHQVQTRSNGGVIRLATGDKLTIEVANFSQTCLFVSNDGMNSFIGLLLTPASV